MQDGLIGSSYRPLLFPGSSPDHMCCAALVKRLLAGEVHRPQLTRWRCGTSGCMRARRMS